MIPKSQFQPSTVVLATPTLQDLLNPVPADVVEFPPSASAEELYGAMFDEAMTMRASRSPLFKVPTSEHLMIEALVDLANPKLIARFQDVSTASAATGRATDAGAQPNAASTSWSEADAQWASKGDLDW